MTTVTIVAVSLAALGAFVWSLIPIEEVTGRRQAGAHAGRAGQPGQRAAARARLLASAVVRTGRPALDGLAEGARSAGRRAGVAWERAGAAWERTGRSPRGRAGITWRSLEGRAGTTWRALEGRAGTGRRSVGGRVRGAHRPRFEQAHDVTGPARFREEYLPVAGETDSAGSRALAALELILLVVLLGGLVALAVLGGAEILRHAFSRLGG
jgi:hypothetical protein